jgi:hypothetical protein
MDAYGNAAKGLLAKPLSVSLTEENDVVPSATSIFAKRQLL